MKRYGFLFLIPFLLLTSDILYAQKVHRDIRTPEYKALQKKLCTGWNTWYNNSVTSYVLLPECFSINLCFTRPGSGNYLKETFKLSDFRKSPYKVKLGLRSDFGYYTSMTLTYKGEEVSIQAATEGGDELILVSPVKGSGNYLVVEAGLLWNRPGMIGMQGRRLIGKFPDRTIKVSTTDPPVRDAYAPTTSPRLTFSLKHEIGIYTGKYKTLAEIKAVISRHRRKEEERAAGYDSLSQAFQAMQTVLAWNTVYDAPNHRVITPVSRSWSKGWGGFVLFDWDTYFTSYMFALFDKNLAYANAVEITKSITPAGFIPNYRAPFGKTSWDRSQPPIGSTVILAIYKKYKEKWFLKEVYNDLLSWNRWWPKHRGIKSYLAWGSDNVPDSLKTISKHSLQAAKFASGLDNSPMYDSIPFNPNTNTMESADVGLMSLYIMDCHSLAKIAYILNKKTAADEIAARASFYTERLATLWDKKSGIFLNKRLDNNKLSRRLSPTNFYPMLAKACSQKQAERMIKEHYYNSKEFYGKYVMPSIARDDPAFRDNNYWRGRIWGPMNFLVYLGMRNYNLKRARENLVNKSYSLFMKNWKATGGVFENYNAVNGRGDDVRNSDGFYSWGALLVFMKFIEKGYMQPSS